MKRVAAGVAAVLVILAMSPFGAMVGGLASSLGIISDAPAGASAAGTNLSVPSEQVLGSTSERLRDSALDGDGAEFADYSTRAEAAAPEPGEIAIAPPPATFAADAAPPKPVPPPSQIRSNRFEGVVPAGGTWAVMIGINDYPGRAHDLRSAVADAEDVNAALAKMGVPGSQRLLLKDGNASAANIRTSAQWLAAHAGEDATAVFFYAGHIRKIGGGTEAIVASDGGQVTDAELATALDGLKAAKTWIGLAGCYAGGFTEVLRQGRILTAAAPSDQLAYENEAFGRSYLVEYMVRRAILNGGTSVIETAFNQAEQGLQRDFPNRVPVQFDAVDGTFDLRPPPPPPPTRTSSSSSSGTTSSGSSSSPPPSSSPTTTAPPSSGGTSAPPSKDDSCANLSVGIVRCSG